VAAERAVLGGTELEITVMAPTGGVISGRGVLVGNLFGVAATTVAEGESVEIAIVGVSELPKLASAVIAAGARVAWDDTAKQVVLPGPSMVPIGIATVAVGNGTTTVRVRLDGVATGAA
jgi:predicted RecA/RadA family phage recombinase